MVVVACDMPCVVLFVCLVSRVVVWQFSGLVVVVFAMLCVLSCLCVGLFACLVV